MQIEETEAKRDRTFEEFLGQYVDYIEGRVEHDDRHANRPITAEGNESFQGLDPKTKAIAENKVEPAAEDSKVEGDEMNTSHTNLNESTMSKKSRTRDDQLNKSKDSTLSKDDYKFELP
jgi:hypothetical protein